MMKIWLNNRLHLVDDELGQHIEELRDQNTKLEIKIANATKLLQTVNDALKRLHKKIARGKLGGHIREKMRDMPDDG